MKRVLWGLIGSIAAACVLGFAMLQFMPGTSLALIQRATAWQAGFEKKSILLGDYNAHYLEGGATNTQTIVLLHGLIDDKNSFVASASELTDTYRVILPDLQGHGENAQSAGRDYSIAGQVGFVDALMKALDINGLVIGGNSMGGHVATAFALAHQDRIDALLILNATGMTLDEPPTYYTYPDHIDVEYMTDMYASAFIEPPRIPGPIMGFLAQDLKAKAPFYNDLVKAVTSGQDFRLDDTAKQLSVPALVIWGSGDTIVPMRYADAYHAALPESELIILQAGHAPQLEVPGLVTDELQQFLSGVAPGT